MNPNKIHEEENPSIPSDVMVAHMNVLEDTPSSAMNEMCTIITTRMYSRNVAIKVHGPEPSESKMAQKGPSFSRAH